MKAILALALLAVLGFTVAGCGSGKKANTGGYTVTLHNNVPSGPITVTGTGTTAISNVKTGTLVRCKGGPGAKVPPRGQGVAGSAGRGTASPNTTAPLTPTGEIQHEQIQLTHLLNGSVTVICNPSK